MKRFPTILVFAVLTICSVNFALSANIKYGKHSEGDKVVASKTIQDKGRFWPFQAEVTETFTAPSGYRISFIKASNSDTNNNADVTIVEGGIGKKSVTIKFKSARGKALNVYVEVYAVDKNDISNSDDGTVCGPLGLICWV